LGWQYCKAGGRLAFLSSAINLPLLRGDRMPYYKINNRKENMVLGLISEIMNVNETSSEDLLKQIYQRIKGKKNGLVVLQQGEQHLFKEVIVTSSAL